VSKLSALLPALVLFAAAPPASADAPAPSGSSGTAAVELTKEAPTRFYGIGFDYYLADDSGLNSTNYNNDIGQYFLPSWSFGKVWFKGTRFNTMKLSGRFLLTRALSGYDEANYSQYSDNGYAVRCSNLTPSANGGTIDPSQVQRCQYSSNYRWDYSDIWLTLSNPKIYTVPYAKVDLNPSIRIILPTSLESRYQTLRLSLTGTLGLARSFLDGKIAIGYSFGFTKYFHQYTSPGVSQDGAPLQNTLVSQGLSTSDIAPTNANFLNDPSHVGTIGGYNPNYSFMHIISADVSPIDKLTITGLYILIDAFAYAAPCSYSVNGVPYDLCSTGQAVAGNSGSNILYVGHKDQQVFWLTVSYQVTDYLGLSVAWINWAPQRKPDGSIRQPFISTDYDAFTTVSIGATVSLEKAAAKIFYR
jgi:hypothetical protein